MGRLKNPQTGEITPELTQQELQAKMAEGWVPVTGDIYYIKVGEKSHAVDGAQLPTILNMGEQIGGVSLKDPEEVKREAHEELVNKTASGFAGGAAAFAEGFGRAALPVLGEKMLVDTGIATKEEIINRKEDRPVLSIGGEVTGLVSPFGAGGLLAKGTGAILKGGLHASKSAVGRGAAAGVFEGAASGAILGASDLYLSDDPLTLESVAGTIGSQALYGAAFGAAVGAGQGAIAKRARAKTSQRFDELRGMGEEERKLIRAAQQQEAIEAFTKNHENLIDQMVLRMDEASDELLVHSRYYDGFRKLEKGQPIFRTVRNRIKLFEEADLATDSGKKLAKQARSAVRQLDRLKKELDDVLPKKLELDDFSQMSKSELNKINSKFERLRAATRKQGEKFLGDFEDVAQKLDEIGHFNISRAEGVSNEILKNLQDARKQAKQLIAKTKKGNDPAAVAGAVRAFQNWEGGLKAAMDDFVPGHNFAGVAQFGDKPRDAIKGLLRGKPLDELNMTHLEELSAQAGSTLTPTEKAALIAQAGLQTDQLDFLKGTPAEWLIHLGSGKAGLKALGTVGNRAAARAASAPGKVAMSTKIVGGLHNVVKSGVTRTTSFKLFRGAQAAGQGVFLSSLIGGIVGLASGKAYGTVFRKSIEKARNAGRVQGAKAAMAVSVREAREASRTFWNRILSEKPGGYTATRGFVPTTSAVLHAVRFAPGDSEKAVALAMPHKRLTSSQKAFAARALELHAPQPQIDAAMRQALLDSGFNHHDADRIEAVFRRKQTFLKAKMPAMSFGQGDGSVVMPSEVQLRTFANYVKGAEDPWTLLADLEVGAMNPQTVEAVKEIYPAFYQMQQEILIEQLQGVNVRNLDRRLASQISILMEIPLTPSQNPEIGSILQKTFVPVEAGGAGVLHQRPSPGSFEPDEPTIGQKVTSGQER